MIHHISLFLCKYLELIPFVFLLFRSFLPLFYFSSKNTYQLAFTVHGSAWKELILMNSFFITDTKVTGVYDKKFLRQKNNSSQIKFCRFQQTHSFRVTKIVKQIKFERALSELEAKKCFQVQSWTKYLRQIVFMSNRALQEKFSFHISGVFFQYRKKFDFGRKTEHQALNEVLRFCRYFSIS